MEYGHSLIINVSTGRWSGNPALWTGKDWHQIKINSSTDRTVVLHSSLTWYREVFLFHHHPNRSSFERFLMTTTARDGSLKTENIFAPSLPLPWASGERRGRLSNLGPSRPPNSTFSNAPDWWDQIPCQNYKLPHSSLQISRRPKTQQNFKLTPPVCIRRKNIETLTLWYLFWKSGPWLLDSRFGCSRNLSVFSFVFCILGGGPMNDGGYKFHFRHLSLFSQPQFS